MQCYDATISHLAVPDLRTLAERLESSLIALCSDHFSAGGLQMMTASLCCETKIGIERLMIFVVEAMTDWLTGWFTNCLDMMKFQVRSKVTGSLVFTTKCLLSRPGTCWRARRSGDTLWTAGGSRRDLTSCQTLTARYVQLYTGTVLYCTVTPPKWWEYKVFTGDENHFLNVRHWY